MLLGGLGGSVDMAQTPVQDGRYAKALQQMMAEQNADSFAARYQELDRKFLDGSISPDKGDELWRLERMRGPVDTSAKSFVHTELAEEDAERHEGISQYNNNLRALKEKYGRAK